MTFVYMLGDPASGRHVAGPLRPPLLSGDMALSLDEFLRITKALADARRFAILERIAASGDAACQHLCEEFPISQPTMSHHLGLLVNAGLIEMRRDGQYVHYRLRAETVRAYITSLQTRLSPAGAPARRSTRPASLSG